jgi:hypothetical protein
MSSDETLESIELRQTEVRELFNAWLADNNRRFSHAVKLRKKKSRKPRWPNDGTEYEFSGISKDLYFSLAPTELRTHFDLDGRYYDTLHDFSIEPARNAHGHFVCAQCQNSFQAGITATKQNRFSSLAELYAEHCFEKLLRWSRRAFKTNNIIIYAGGIDDPHMALVAPAHAIRYFAEPYFIQRVITPVSPKRKKTEK